MYRILILVVIIFIKIWETIYTAILYQFRCFYLSKTDPIEILFYQSFY